MLAGVLFLAAAAALSPRADVNYAMGGSTTGSGSFVDHYQPEVAAALRARGFDTGGLARQLDLAERTLFDVDPWADVFWLWAGANDYIVGERDPTRPSAQIGAALERLYTNVGARIFVVPNLPALGFFPAVAERPDATEGMNRLIVVHNQVLAGVLAEFAAEHPDATVIPVDMFDVFSDLLVDVRWDHVRESCLDVAVPRGQSCNGWLFVDKLHPATGAAWSFALAAAWELWRARPFWPTRRLIGFGDSLSDQGQFLDVTTRAFGPGQASPAGTPYWEGRFSNGPVVTDYLQWLLGVEVPAHFFAQPHQVGLSATRGPDGVLHGRVDVHATVLVPGKLAAGLALLELGDTYCVYAGRLLGCSGGAIATSRIDVDHVALHAWDAWTPSLAVELLYY
jgi:thermolabile hemolysin